MQNDAEWQEIAVGVPPGSMSVGPDHEVPLKVAAMPFPATVAQNDDDGHDIELSSTLFENQLKLVLDHEAPFQVVTPLSRFTATQNEVEWQEIDDRP
jgi:hypothetical protein